MRWIVLCAFTCFSGCGDPAADDGRPPVAESVPGSALPAVGDTELEDDVAVGPCQHEQKRQCKVLLKERNGIRTCALGEQRCEDGQWGACRTNPEPADEPDEGGAGAAGAESR